MTGSTTEDLMRANFDLVDENKDGYLNKDEVVMLFRGLGQTPSDSKMKLAKTELPDLSDFQTFKAFFAKFYEDPATTEEIVKAFTQFDPFKTGKISVAKFRELVTSAADSLSQAEVDELLKLAGLESAVDIMYADFAKVLALGPGNNLI